MKKIPYLPLSALVFYLSVLLLWQVGILPSPVEIVNFLENLYSSYGLIGLFFASFLEGLVYIGLYFPGSFIVALAVFLSDGSFISLFSISLIVACALTITSIINYVLGRRIKTKVVRDKKYTKKGLLLSMLHPNSLAFYFFNSGIKKHNAIKIIFVPLIMIPYGLVLAYILYLFKDGLRSAVESPFIMITAILVWVIISTIINLSSKD